MQSTDTTDAQHAAALAAANLMEIEEHSTPAVSEQVSVDRTGIRKEIKSEAQRQVPCSKPSTLLSSSVTVQPRPQVRIARTQARENTSLARPPVRQHANISTSNHSAAQTLDGKTKFGNDEALPVQNSDQDQVRKRSLQTTEASARKRRRLMRAALAKGFALHWAGWEQWPCELMIIANRDEQNGTPLWGACVLCSRGCSPNRIIYTQKYPFKYKKIMNHLQKEHPETEWKHYSELHPHQKLEFLRNRPSSFQQIRDFMMRTKKASGSWNGTEYSRIYLSSEPIEDLVSSTVNGETTSKQPPHRFRENLPTQRMVPGDLLTQRMVPGDLPTQRMVPGNLQTQRLVPVSESNAKIAHNNLPRSIDPEQSNIRTASTVSTTFHGSRSYFNTHTSVLHPDDLENNAGRCHSLEKINWEQDAEQMDPRSPRGVFEASKEYLILPSHFPKHTVRTHVGIPQLVACGLLRDPSSPKSQTVRDAFLIPGTYLDFTEGRQGLMTRKGNENCTRLLSAITLFYLVRGFSCSMIARVLDLMTDESETIDGKPESLLPLIVCAGNSICAESLRILRNELTRNRGKNWTFPLLTRPCPELSNSGIELVVPMYTSCRERYDLHLVSIRCETDAGKTVLSILDTVCQEWRVRLSGINSGIPAHDIKRKGVERAVFEALVNSDGVQPMVIVSMDCPDSKRLLLPEALSIMKEEEFAEILKLQDTRIGTKLRADNLERHKLIEQHKNLPMMLEAILCDDQLVDHKNRSRRTNWDPCNVEFDRKWLGLPNTLKEFAEGLRALYERRVEPLLQPGCLRAGLVETEFLSEPIIDPVLERIFHARSLLRVWASQVLPVDCRYGPPNRRRTANTAGIWEGNWSNLSRDMVEVAPWVE